MPSVSEAGYWHPVTSSVDWCERNYEVFFFVAEFWNTVTCLGMVGAGLVGLWLHWDCPIETRFRLAFGLVAFLGGGSILFHAMLKWWGQMLDEVPMLWTALTTSYIVLEDGPTSNGKHGRWLPWALALHAAGTSAAVALASGRWQFFLFHLSFGSAQFFSLFRVFRIYQRRKAEGDAAAVGLFRSGGTAYVVGLVCWQLDLLCCHWLSERWPAVSGLPNPQLHAWWHMLVSTGFYCLITLCCYDRLKTLHGAAAAVAWWGRVVPYARCGATKTKHG